MVIGYYIHHQGHGHLHRAASVAAACPVPVHGLSTAARPAGWTGGWTELPDDAGAAPGADTSAYGRLHYAPTTHEGYRQRMRTISAWIEQAVPRALVADVSVEVAMLARLQGVPVLTMAQPGRRTDGPHRLGNGVSEHVVAPWPAAASELLDMDGSGPVLTHVGAISRYPPQIEPEPVEADQVVVLHGSGGSDVTADAVAEAARVNHRWTWHHLAPGPTWRSDPWPLLCSSAVIIGHCGQNAVAEIAAARRPAVLVPQPRPFDEQHKMAAALRSLDMPVLVLDAWPEPDAWDDLLKEAAELDPARWALWNDGRGATRVGELLGQVSKSRPRR